MDPAVEGPQVRHVKITNNNVFSIEDRFDSVKFTFPPRKPVTIPMDAARHIFGFHLQSTEPEVFNHVTRRFGWNTPDNIEQGRLYFSNIDIRPVTFKMIEVDADGEEAELPAARLDEPQRPVKIDYIPTKLGRPRKPVDAPKDADPESDE